MILRVKRYTVIFWAKYIYGEHTELQNLHIHITHDMAGLQSILNPAIHNV